MEGDSVELKDEDVWRALARLSGADLLEGPGVPLHGPEDFAVWFEEFRHFRAGEWSAGRGVLESCVAPRLRR